MILLTGHTGFIGKHLLRKLQSHYECSVIGVSRSSLPTDNNLGCDLSDYKLVSSMMKFLEPDIVVHFAANPNTKQDDKNPSKILDDNIKATMNLLSCCKPSTKFIYASSVTVYGDQLDNTEESPVNPVSIYATTKLASENLVNYFTKHYEILGVNLRLCATIGTGSTHGMLHDFAKKIKEPGDFFHVFGNQPGSIKPFLHIEDLCNSVVHCIDDNLYGTYNVCPSDNLSVESVAELFLKKFNSDKKIKWNGNSWSGDNPKIFCRNNKIIESGFDFNYPTSLLAVRAFLNAIC
jgi:UDP-glucose 4-epimerase